MLHHAVGIDSETRLAIRLWFEACPDVHTARIEPSKERLLVPVGAVDEVERRVKKLLVHRFHALLVERAGVLAVLLAPFAEAGIFPRGLRRGRHASEHPAGTELEFELGVLGIVGVLRLILGIKVVKIAEELIETVNRGQKLIAIASPDNGG
jgi:hypothetical protein